MEDGHAHIDVSYGSKRMLGDLIKQHTGRSFEFLAAGHLSHRKTHNINGPRLLRDPGAVRRSPSAIDSGRERKYVHLRFSCGLRVFTV